MWGPTGEQEWSPELTTGKERLFLHYITVYIHSDGDRIIVDG